MCCVALFLHMVFPGLNCMVVYDMPVTDRRCASFISMSVNDGRNGPMCFFFHFSLPLASSLAFSSLSLASHFRSFPRLCSTTPSVTCFSLHFFCLLPLWLNSPCLIFSSLLFSSSLLFPFFLPSLFLCSVCTDRRALHCQQWFILLRQMSVAYSMLLLFCFISTHCT